MAIGVTFPENEDAVTFGRKNEMLVLLVSKLGIYQKELGNYAGYWLRKVFFVLARSQVNLLRYLTLESYIPTSTLSTK